MPGNNAEVYVRRRKKHIPTAVSAANIVQLSADEYTALYLLANDTGLHIGFGGQEPFISVSNNTDNLPAITSVRFQGIRPCSCEDVPPCRSIHVPGDWLICDTGR